MDGNIFNSQGVRVAIVSGSSIFSPTGEKLYNLRGTNIYRLSGELVGHLATSLSADKHLDKATDRLFPSGWFAGLIIPRGRMHSKTEDAMTKEKKTAEELAAMILQDLSNMDGCPKRGVTVTVYGLNPWNSMLTFGVDAGPVPNKAELQSFCDIITERLKRLYDVHDVYDVKP
jgi:hypothetical protein